MYFFKKIKFRNYILICISSPLVCILYTKGDNIQISILICISSPLLQFQYRKGDNIQISILICISSPFLFKKHSKGDDIQISIQYLNCNLYSVHFHIKGDSVQSPLFNTSLHLYSFPPKNNQAPFFLYISPKGIPFLKTLTWSKIIKHHTKYMMHFFKRIKFRNYIICISSPLVCILYRKGDNIQISILICISSPLLQFQYRKGDNIQISILICISSPFLYKKHSKGDDIQISIQYVNYNLYSVHFHVKRDSVQSPLFNTSLHLYSFPQKNNQAPFFLYISPKEIPFLKTLTWSKIIKHLTKYMMHFFKKIKFRNYILICISSPLVCILYRKGDNIQISILICISSPLLQFQYRKGDNIQISILICISSPFLYKKHSNGEDIQISIQYLNYNLYSVHFHVKGDSVQSPQFNTSLHLYSFPPKNNQAPFFLYISPKGIPFLKTLTWSNIIKHHTKYMTYFFKRIKFGYYILICISSPLLQF